MTYIETNTKRAQVKEKQRAREQEQNGPRILDVPFYSHGDEILHEIIITR